MDLKPFAQVTSTFATFKLVLLIIIKYKQISSSLYDLPCSVAGKSPSEEILLGDLNLKPKTKIMMMGTREEILVCLLVQNFSIS